MSPMVYRLAAGTICLSIRLPHVGVLPRKPHALHDSATPPDTWPCQYSSLQGDRAQGELEGAGGRGQHPRQGQHLRPLLLPRPSQPDGMHTTHLTACQPVDRFLGFKFPMVSHTAVDSVVVLPVAVLDAATAPVSTNTRRAALVEARKRV